MARPRSEQARQKMLTAAADLLVEHGVRGVSIDAVAKRSGVAKTTIYRHFDSKNALMVAALDGRMPVPEMPDTGSFRSDLIALYHEVLPIFQSAELRALFLDVMAVSARDPELAALQGAMMADRFVVVQTIVGRGVERGELPADLDFGTIIDVIEGPLVLRSLRDPTSLADLDLEALADTAIARLHA